MPAHPFVFPLQLQGINLQNPLPGLNPESFCICLQYSSRCFFSPFSSSTDASHIFKVFRSDGKMHLATDSVRESGVPVLLLILPSPTHPFFTDHGCIWRCTLFRLFSKRHCRLPASEVSQPEVWPLTHSDGQTDCRQSLFHSAEQSLY